MMIKNTVVCWLVALFLINNVSQAFDHETLARQAEQEGKLKQALMHYIRALKENENHQQLREKIIKLVQKVQTPAIPEGYYRHMARGEAFVESAKDTDGYSKAANEFQKASNEAPWLPQVYYNLGIVQDKASHYNEAIKSLKLYLLAAPDAPDARKVRNHIYKIEVKNEQTRLAVVEKKKAEEKKQSSFEGKWQNHLGYATQDWKISAAGSGFTVRCLKYIHKTDSSINGCAWFGQPYEFSGTVNGRILSGTYNTHPHVPPGTKIHNSLYLNRLSPREIPINLRLSADGNQIDVDYVFYGRTCNANGCQYINKNEKRETWVRIK